MYRLLSRGLGEVSKATKAPVGFSTVFNFSGVPNAFNLSEMGVIDMISFLYQFGYDLVEGCMENSNITKFMESKQKFDVCIVENFNADAFIVRTPGFITFRFDSRNIIRFQGLAEHVDCVLISYTTFGAVKWIDDMTSK